RDDALGRLVHDAEPIAPEEVARLVPDVPVAAEELLALDHGERHEPIAIGGVALRVVLKLRRDERHRMRPSTLESLFGLLPAAKPHDVIAVPNHPSQHA